MERETRYLVLKIKDINATLTTTELDILLLLSEKIDTYRKNKGKMPLNCVVVEDDWPEYEDVWKMIEERVDSIEK